MLFSIPVPSSRVFGLDLLRAGAILTVMLSHTNVYLPAAWAPVYSALQWDGVGNFFVLSGFLIGGILLKTLDKHPASRAVLVDFWSRRWLRTLPPYLLVLYVSFALAMMAHTPEATWLNLLKYSLFSQNLRNPHPIPFGEAWSLSIEEWFYLLIPSAIFLVIWLGKLAPRYAVLAVAIGVLVLVTFYRYTKFVHSPPHDIIEWDKHFRKIVVTRLDSLMYGVIGAYIARYHAVAWQRAAKWLVLPGLAMVLLLRPDGTMDVTTLYVCVFSFAATSLGTLFMLPFLSQWQRSDGLFSRIVTHISLISYSLYLLHANLIYLNTVEPLRQRLGFSPGVAFLAVWVLSFAAATLLYKYFEVPVMALRKHLKPIPSR